MTVKDRVLQRIDTISIPSFELLAKMVQEASTQTKEAGVQELVAQKLINLGLIVDIWEPDYAEMQKSPYFISARENFNDSPNVVGVLKGQGGGRSIILNGHIDVVPEGDRSKWNTHPYSGKIENGRMYGRGTTDMKGGNIALLMAIEAIVSEGVQLKGDVIFQSVIEEESGGAGTLATVLRGYRADAAIIPEPTNLKLFVKQQGSLWFRIVVKGLAAHGGTRYEGVSAIEKAWLVHKQILKLEQDRNDRIQDPMYEGLPIPIPINVGTIRGGNWPSSVPDEVVLEGRLGVGPEEAVAAAKEDLEQALQALAAQDSWFALHPPQLEFFGAQWLPNSVATNHPFVEVLEAKYREVLNADLRIEASPWGTDAGILGTVGGIPAIVIGPGETSVAHYPNEYIELEAVVQAARLFALTIMDWCGATT
jgi:acetylornithine deacetylase